MGEFTFATHVRVRFAETDAQGVAHNAAYLVWFEVARVDYLAEFAGGYPALRARGIEAFVTEANVRYAPLPASTIGWTCAHAAATCAAPGSASTT